MRAANAARSLRAPLPLRLGTLLCAVRVAAACNSTYCPFENDDKCWLTPSMPNRDKCACSSGEAHMTGKQSKDRGVTSYEYTCCPNSGAHVSAESCDDFLRAHANGRERGYSTRGLGPSWYLFPLICLFVVSCTLARKRSDVANARAPPHRRHGGAHGGARPRVILLDNGRVVREGTELSTISVAVPSATPAGSNLPVATPVGGQAVAVGTPVVGVPVDGSHAQAGGGAPVQGVAVAAP